jgi:dephospho-CoA kinase
MARLIGLTGGLASGKSTVAGILRELGATVVDADAIARAIVEPGTEAFREIVKAFGPDVLGRDGRINRSTLAARIFADRSDRERLNQITHPRVRARMREEAAQLRQRLLPDAVIILDIPLLLDTAAREDFSLDGVIVVAVGEATQVARARDGLTEEEARQRLRAQRPLCEKVAEADWVVDNTGPLEETRRQVEALWRRLTA